MKVQKPFICVVAMLAIIFVFWQYNRYLLATFASKSIAQEYHIPQDQIAIEGVQELGFWRTKLNPFTPHSWAVFYHFNKPYPANLTHMGYIDEPNFGHFDKPRIANPSPAAAVHKS